MSTDNAGNSVNLVSGIIRLPSGWDFSGSASETNVDIGDRDVYLTQTDSFPIHGDPTDMRESTSVFQIRTINWSKLDI